MTSPTPQGKEEVVTIDGPAGAGKSTISRLVAARLSYLYLDTGALYRAVAYGLQRERWTGGEAGIVSLLGSMKIALERRGDRLLVLVNGEEVTDKIRTEEIGLLASRVSALKPVRETLLGLQRQIAATGGVVAEGRDMGTVVFPQARVKFYLDATVRERALRRYRELRERGVETGLAAVEQDIEQRDRQDRERAIAPLRIPSDAVVIDSTQKSISQIVDIMMDNIEERRRIQE